MQVFQKKFFLMLLQILEALTCDGSLYMGAPIRVKHAADKDKGGGKGKDKEDELTIVVKGADLSLAQFPVDAFDAFGFSEWFVAARLLKASLRRPTRRC